MMLRAYGPAALALLGTVAAMVLLSCWPTSPLLAGLMTTASWTPLLALAVFLGLVVAPTYRLVQWRRGEPLGCLNCGGPLRYERVGRARMGAHTAAVTPGEKM